MEHIDIKIGARASAVSSLFPVACEASATQFIDHADRDHAQVNIQADGKNRSVSKERRITNGVSRSERRSESHSFTIHRDLMADPYLICRS